MSDTVKMRKINKKKKNIGKARRHYCNKRGRWVTLDEFGEVFESAFFGFITDSYMFGWMFGGDLTGAIIGDMLNGGDTFEEFVPETYTLLEGESFVDEVSGTGFSTAEYDVDSDVDSDVSSEPDLLTTDEVLSRIANSRVESIQDSNPVSDSHLKIYSEDPEPVVEPAPVYSAPAYSSPEPSYSEPDRSYSSPSYESSSSSFGGGGGDYGGGGDCGGCD